MDRTLGRFKLVLVTGLVTLALTAFAGSVSATPGPTPNGHIGACNMLQAWGVGARGGMANAMSVNNLNGNLGMWRAVANTSITGVEECPSY
jgi:hypothetical protein